jgi:hypothetical protein
MQRKYVYMPNIQQGKEEKALIRAKREPILKIMENKLNER